MNQLSDMLLSMTSSVSDLGAALKAYIAKNKSQLADKDIIIKTLQTEVETLKSAQNNTDKQLSSEKDAEIKKLQEEIKNASSHKDEQIAKLQKEADEATEMYLKVSEEKDRTQKLLYTEMNKVDQIQMELELAERERDIALRKQGINSEQKQFLAKMEHEGYKINETIERIEHISDMIKDILAEEMDEDDSETHDERMLEKA